MIYLLTTCRTKRLGYVADWLFAECWGLSWQWLDHGASDSGKIIIEYECHKSRANSYMIPRQGLLDQKGITDQKIEVQRYNNIPYFFQMPVEGDALPFDIFALIFWCLCRYEEYLGQKTDHHGRFPGQESLAFRHDFLRLPIVDYWVDQLAQKLEKKFNVIIDRATTYQNIPTVDIDLPYAYHAKPVKNILAVARDISIGKWKKAKERFCFLINNDDPFDTYDYLRESLQHLPAVFFFLCRWKRPFDENHLVGHSLFSSLVTQVATEFQIGIHPSYSSNEVEKYVSEEIEILQQLTNKEIHHSRQHFLRVRLPVTYRLLESCSIQDDFSMMYPSHSGFRAGTCHSFLWYDLMDERISKLRVHSPFTMDVTLKDYEKLTPDTAILSINERMDHIKKFKGEAIWIWHNSSFSSLHDWQGWSAVFEYLLQDR